jgi:Na+(H+)/acetate symporter ActP
LTAAQLPTERLMFGRPFSGDLVAPVGSFEETELGTMFRSRWVWVIWVIVGLVVAWEHIYITVRFLEGLASALLAVVLWPLVLLGVNLRVH